VLEAIVDRVGDPLSQPNARKHPEDGPEPIARFRAARPRRLYEEVVAQVMELIAGGQLPPGSRLPPERQLELQIGVSRNVLREAFRVLEERGIVFARPGGGRYIRPVGPASPAIQSDPIERLEVATIFDILETRELLEIEIVALACARITPNEQPLLRAAAARTDTWRDNLEFHTMLASLTHNYMLERLVREQLELLHDVNQRQHYASTHHSQSLLQEHAPIAEAVIARDVHRAQTLMRRHFSHTRKSLAGAPGERDQSQ
jgi:GntR family transcriptional regulator, transcriptional repressor for pyruvate dehydrogenase complex